MILKVLSMTLFLHFGTCSTEPVASKPAVTCPLDSPCDITCCAPDPINYDLERIVELQPLYVTLYPNIPIFAGVDNVCYSFSPLLEDDSYFLNISTVYSNGLKTTDSYTVAQAETGIFLVGSATCTMQMSVFAGLLGNTTGCVMFLMYTCFLFGECPSQCGNEIPVLGLSSRGQPISEDCLTTARIAMDSHEVPGQEYFRLPMRGPSACGGDPLATEEVWATAESSAYAYDEVMLTVEV